MRLCFFILLVLAALSRLLFLGSNPAGVFRDEAEKGYSAWCVMEVGGVYDLNPFREPDLIVQTSQRLPGMGALPQELRNEPAPPRPRILPFFVNVWGSTTSMIYQYAAAPLVLVGGLNAWMLRLPAAIIGIFTVIFAFLLARRLEGDPRTGLWTMAFLAFSPWHLVFSRWAQQGIFVPFLLSAALILMLKPADPLCKLDNKRALRRMEDRFRLGIICFGLAFYAYSGARPFLLLFVGWMVVVFLPEIRRHYKQALRLSLITILVLAPTFYAMLSGGGEGMGRFQRISVFGTDEALPRQLLQFFINYISHLNPWYLFFSGDSLPRHGLPGFGVMMHVEVLFFPVGLFLCLRRRNKADLLLIGWFLLAPVSAALTREGIPHALRTLHAIPAPQIISALGAVACWDWLRAKSPRLRWAMPTLLGVQAAAILFVLFFVYPAWSAPWFEYGVREAIEERAEITGSELSATSMPLHIQAGGAPPGGNLPYCYELYFYHAKISPHLIQSQGLSHVPIRLHPPGRPAESLLRQMQKGESLLAPSMDYYHLYQRAIQAQGIKAKPVLFPSSPFSDSPSEALRLVVAP
ncbi:MAG: phospholipid carrier-dependent glycosyltransferase [Candidatus Sumerlaeia bacterium]